MKIDYELLEHSFKKQHEEYENAAESRLEFLSREIFDFTTYDGSMDELFAARAIEVCRAITERTTYDYIQDPDNYRWYLLMCNMPFFSKRIEWGTSIRGAYWTSHAGHKVELQSCGLYTGDSQLIEVIEFTGDEWEVFVRAMIEFAAPEMKQAA